MKLNNLSWIMLALAVLVLAGCGGTQTRPDSGAQVEERGGAEAGGAGGAQTAGIRGGGAWQGSPLDNPDSPLYVKVIYFDFDRSDIRPEFIDKLRAHADYLNSNPQTRMVIEGHCDERGSREYNIGLGERRANTVRTFLEAEGVSPRQLETVSYGEERPANPGHDEAAWAQNRRAELVYQ